MRPGKESPSAASAASRRRPKLPHRIRFTSHLPLEHPHRLRVDVGPPVVDGSGSRGCRPPARPRRKPCQAGRCGGPTGGGLAAMPRSRSHRSPLLGVGTSRGPRMETTLANARPFRARRCSGPSPCPRPVGYRVANVNLCDWSRPARSAGSGVDCVDHYAVAGAQRQRGLASERRIDVVGHGGGVSLQAATRRFANSHDAGTAARSRADCRLSGRPRGTWRSWSARTPATKPAGQS